MTTWTLDELMTEASVRIKSGNERLAQALDEYRIAGEALSLAQATCPWGEWRALLAKNGLVASVVNRYIRLARYWDEIPGEIKAGTYERAGRGAHGCLMIAMRSIEHLPKTRSAPPKRDAAAWEPLAFRMKADGCTVAQIAETCGVSKSVAQRALNPISRERERKNALKRKRDAQMLRIARERESRDALAREDGGDRSRVYSLLRQALAAIDKCSTDPLMRDAMAHAHRAEDSIVQAMREARRQVA